MDGVEQAGGIAFRHDGGETKILLVRSKKNPTIWVLPKGHIERGETAAAAAVRETHEEGGVSGDLVGPIGEPVEFPSGRELVRVQYFLIRATSDRPSPEGRQKGWFTIAEAHEQLPVGGTRALLKQVGSLYGK
jgi:ADP-ribose pyrophosphatase YjhB (NUDIX family)